MSASETKLHDAKAFPFRLEQNLRHLVLLFQSGSGDTASVTTAAPLVSGESASGTTAAPTASQDWIAMVICGHALLCCQGWHVKTCCHGGARTCPVLFSGLHVKTCQCTMVQFSSHAPERPKMSFTLWCGPR